jgi:hypothetical protein
MITLRGKTIVVQYREKVDEIGKMMDERSSVELTCRRKRNFS